MRINEHTALLAPRVLLVPYSAHHVPRYHEWMQDEEIRAATASEPLTLDEEYAMQRSWRQDADKLTFIACLAPSASSSTAAAAVAVTRAEATVHDTDAMMIGDVNLFLVPDDEDDDEEEDGGGGHQRQQQNGTTPTTKPAPVVGEVEIMIAEKTCQGQGYGQAVLAAFLTYIRRHADGIVAEYAASLPSASSRNGPLQKKDGESGGGGGGGGEQKAAFLRHLRVKIDADNARSLRLFEKAGFARVSDAPNFFGELELRRGLSSGTEEEEGGGRDSGSAVEVEYCLGK